MKSTERLNLVSLLASRVVSIGSTSLFLLGITLLIVSYVKWKAWPVVQNAAKEQWIVFTRGKLYVLSLDFAETSAGPLVDDYCRKTRARFPQIIQGTGFRSFLGFATFSMPFSLDLKVSRPTTTEFPDGLPVEYAADGTIQAEQLGYLKMPGEGAMVSQHYEPMIYRRRDIPLWPIMTLGAPGTFILIAKSRQRRRERQIARGLCWRCGYDLRGSPGPNCPECGNLFDR